MSEQIFTDQQLSEMVTFSGDDDSEILNSTNKTEDEIGELEKLKFNTDENTQADTTADSGSTPNTGADESAKESQQPGQQQPGQQQAPPVVDDGSFTLDLSMIPGRMMLDMMDGGIRRVEDAADLWFHIRNKPGLGLLDQQKEMLTPIADACMKQAKIKFKSPWHALGTGLFLIVATNAIFGKWERTDKEPSNEYKTRKNPLKKKQTIIVEGERKIRKPGSGRPKGSKNKKTQDHV